MNSVGQSFWEVATCDIAKPCVPKFSHSLRVRKRPTLRKITINLFSHLSDEGMNFGNKESRRWRPFRQVGIGLNKGLRIQGD